MELSNNIIWALWISLESGVAYVTGLRKLTLNNINYPVVNQDKENG
jgi:hypothetical protein